MGQGYSHTTLPAGPSAIEAPELADLTFEKVLGGARFLRTVRARRSDGVVVAKVCMKSSATISFKKYARVLRDERRRLANVPNVLTYSRIIETGVFGILVRQYVHSSLYDRISTRPFLENIEKKWIAFQLLCAVQDCHARGVFHGDIKSENVLVTSWGWVFLTDFSSAFKPVYLPEDNPADFSFYFDTSARRTCYLAPERFAQTVSQDDVQWNMDIFSLGCVLAELFTESPIFTLSQLFKYRRGEYDPTVPLLNKIDDEHIRALISSMIKLDPESRWHAQDYLDEYKGKAFPIYFYQHFQTLMEEITVPQRNSSDTKSFADERIDRIYNDFAMLSVSLGYSQSPDIYKQSSLFPMQVDLPGSRHTADPKPVSEGTFILLNIITASTRNATRATSKIRACELMLAFAERLPDEAKLDRILPYVMPLLDDDDEMVLVTTLRTMSQILALVQVTSLSNASLFPQYIFPRLQAFVSRKAFKTYATVRATYAACLATMADTASRFLTMTQVLKADGSVPDLSLEDATDNYDRTRNELIDQFEAQTKVFLTDTDSSVRRAFLSSVTSLCVFFGEARSSDIILSHLNTYLNDRDWILRCSFFRTMVGVSVYLGSSAIEDFILPLMLQALTDPQDFVVEQALRSFASMAELGLLQRPKTWELINVIARFTMHPTQWVREAATHFVAASASFLSVADIRVLVMPLITPYLKIPVASLNESELLDALKKPLPRAVLDIATTWAGRVDRSAFWSSVKNAHQLSHGSTIQIPPVSAVKEYMKPRALARVPKNDEDEQYLVRLRSAGLREEDEFKLLAFREYIWGVARRRSPEDAAQITYDDVVKLAKYKIRPQTIIFEQNASTHKQPIEHDSASTTTTLVPPTRSSRTSSVSTPSSVETRIPQSDALKRDSLGPELALSPASTSTSLSRTVDHALRSKDSRAGFLLGSESSKAAAEVATIGATASGKLERGTDLRRSGTASIASTVKSRPPGLSKMASTNRLHNYQGADPTVLKMLDNVYADSFPVDEVGFGPIIQLGQRGGIPSTSGSSLWRPQGKLVAVLNEHTASVTRLLVSPDHAFFLSASDDGAVKIWDSDRLENNITHRSRGSYKVGSKVTSICLIDSTHSFVCAAQDGSVHVVKVDVSAASKESGHARRYGKLKVCRHWQIPSTESEYTVWMEHMRKDAVNTLIIATNLNRILAIDLKRMDIVFELHNPAQHGAILCFCIGRKQDWLLVGTSNGILDLWDLRFQLKLRSWSFASAAPITRMQLHPSRRAGKRNHVCITGGTHAIEVSVWNIEKAICTEVYRVSSDGLPNLRNYELKNLEDDRQDILLSKAGDLTIATDSVAVTTSMVMAQQPSAKDAETMLPFVITGGPANGVRFWDPDRLEWCMLVSGSDDTDGRPSYSMTTLGLDTRVISEKKAGETISESIESARIESDGPVKRKQSKFSRYDQIRLSSQQLLNGHLDTVMDVALLEKPFGMIISSDRAGQIFVHQ